ncbi:pectin acetylesterase-family hydrolase [Leptospira sp. GIMC2001]|uniref:pectin acetylesterase-family hydrolase n=1 Tax=Leptospira sp. GIMC2001 TaxID=1513297 RepID=UPI002349EB0D|nr:pectin acetylesterase-family hydrolase [Leptospira sp. GIMC2001]WCL48331.1 pectin acetylesterase-family hydrolase [Leptospira sp. GIMC2001]
MSTIKIYILLLIFVLNCSQEKSNESDRETLLLGALVYETVRTPYQEHTPVAGSISLTLPAPVGNKTFNFDPACSGVPNNQTFKFYTKKGNSNNYLINFMGGGACWDAKNCLGTSTPTYFNQADRFSNLAARYAFNGFLDETNPINPFKDWNIVFIPYCSGDLHWGSNDTSYNHPTTGVSTPFKHRGFQNFLSVLDFMRKSSDFNPPSNAKILVTGQSAGGYGALYNFPYIAEAFSGREVHLISDASNGIVPNNFEPIIETAWSASSNLADWITGVTKATFANGNLTLGDFFRLVANYYPNSRVGQYTTQYDGNQRFFYNVQLLIQGSAPYYSSPITYTDSSSLWGPSDGRLVPNAVSCDWVNQARNEMIQKSALASNYKYYIAAGDVHTVSTSLKFYTEFSGGRLVYDWYQDIISGGINWRSYDCQNRSAGCSPPTSVQVNACTN